MQAIRYQLEEAQVAVEAGRTCVEMVGRANVAEWQGKPHVAEAMQSLAVLWMRIAIRHAGRTRAGREDGQ